MVTAAAAPLNEAGCPAARATWRARFSAITLLLSSSISCTTADSGGEDTLAMPAACAGAVCATGGPVTWMPSAASKAANEAAAMPAGSVVRARRLYGSSESSGAPAVVSRPWSTSRAAIGVTSPVLT